jgi:drug/metabolite transporter (DMT)-like permease
MEISQIVILVALLPPLLFATTNLIDAKLMRDYEAGPLMAISGFFNLFVAILLWGYIQIQGITFSLNDIFPLVLNGIFYIVGSWIYLNVLKTEESSRVVPFFQTIPIYGLIGAYLIIGERLEPIEILGIFILVLGGLLLSIKDGVVRKKMALMMILSSGFIALNDVIFAQFGRESAVVVVLFADIAGKALFGLSILFNKQHRQGFVAGLRNKFFLQSTNELLFITGDLIFDWAKVIAPVAIVQAMASTQPLFLLILAMIATRFFPSIHKEDFSGFLKWQKILGVLVVVVGGILLSV